MENIQRFKNGLSKAILTNKILLFHVLILSGLIFYFIGPISLIWFLIAQIVFVLSDFSTYKKILSFYRSLGLLTFVSLIILVLFYFKTPCLVDTFITFNYGLSSILLLAILQRLIQEFSILTGKTRYLAISLGTVFYLLFSIILIQHIL